jgi:hypothetical protein
MLDIPQDGSGAQGSSVIYFKVDDINGAYETLSSLGARFEGKPNLIAKMPDHEL